MERSWPQPPRAREQIRFTPPAAYQERDGVRHPVAVAYTLRGSTYGFRVGRYDHAAPLVIDPVLQSTYIGGAEPGLHQRHRGRSLERRRARRRTYVLDERPRRGRLRRPIRPDAHDAAARPRTSAAAAERRSSASPSIRRAARSMSQVSRPRPTSPARSPGAQPANAGSDDGFVARLDSTLTTLLGATYLGGACLDRIVAIAIHPGNRRGLRRRTNGLARFPGHRRRRAALTGPSLDFIDRDGFVARFDPTLHTLLQATYLGGSGPEYLHALAIHPVERRDLRRRPDSGDPDFPGAAGGANAMPTPPSAAPSTAFISRLDPSLTRLIQSTYLGSSGSDDIYGIAIHPASGEIYVVGWADWVDLPGHRRRSPTRHRAEKPMPSSPA